MTWPSPWQVSATLGLRRRSREHRSLRSTCCRGCSGRGSGSGRRGEVILEPFGEFSVPSGIMRELRNVGTEPAHILAILGGTDPGKQHGRRINNERAKELGLFVNEDGGLVVTR